MTSNIIMSDIINSNIKDNIVTFIIPTIGRDTLLNAINSLLNQTIEEWKAIIIFDGIKKTISISDDRIKIIESNKLGLNINNAGLVRNYGMSLVDTKWIGFLDDDDIIADDYLDCFYKELFYRDDLDVVIFRMNLNNRIIPKLNTDNFYVCDVGISFILKKSIFDNNIIFIPDGAEDYLYLHNIRINNYKIVISPYIKYFVKKDEYEENDILGNRLYINFNNNFNNNLNNNYLNNKSKEILIFGYCCMNILEHI